ncbi:hypothetical protein ACFX19_004337 [Malus domestica]
MVEINKLAFPEDEEGSRVFRQLKAYCFELLASPKPQEALLCSLVSAPFSSPVSASCSPAILRCLEELLKKCCFGSVDQLVVVLKKLTYGALLSPSDASEEFREGIFKCFGELLLNLLPCFDDSCACKQIFGVLMLLEYRDMKAPLGRT